MSDACAGCGHGHHEPGQCRYGWSVVVRDGRCIGWREEGPGSGCECGDAKVRAEHDRDLAAARARGVAEERARCLAIVQAARLVALDDLDAVNAGRLRTLEIRIEEGS